jgi:transcriptional regulator with XRE-family HTH domain
LAKSPTSFPEIHKEAFIKAREALGLSRKDLSGKTCLSERQIEQIENGETSSFYGAQVKLTAAKKVAGILNLKEEDAFSFTQAALEIKATPEQVAQEKRQSGLVRKSSLVNQVESKQNIDQPPSTKSKSVVTKKKAILSVGVVLALVFSIINLRPLFFPEKEEVVVVEEVQPPSVSADQAQDGKLVSTPNPEAAGSSTAATLGDCPGADSAPVIFRPDMPKKAGDMVYLQSKSSQTVCVIDASGKTQNKTLEPGVGVSVMGKPPLKVLTSGLAGVEVYYQGVKVRLANATAKTVVLEPTELNQSLAPTDSQLR